MKLTRYREFLSFCPLSGVRLLAAESDRFKTVRARVYFLEPIQHGTATENSLLAHVLRAGSEEHTTRRDIARACEELYGAALGVSVTRFADVQGVVGTIDFPGDRFLPSGSKELTGALGLLSEILTRPATDGSALRAEIVDAEKHTLSNELSSLRDNKPNWAQMQATVRTYAGTPGEIFEHGALEDLPEITPESLLQRHRLLVGNARVMAFVTGPVKEQTALKALDAALKLPRGKRLTLPTAKKLRNRKQIDRAKEKAETEQTHLIHTWTGGKVYGEDGYAAMLYADALFGGYGMSRLFKIVREKHGLAYAISSSYHRARGAIVAQAAVDPGRADKALKLIRSEFKRLQEGYTDAEFQAVRESLIESRRSAWEGLGATIGDTVFQTVLGFKRSARQQLTDIRKVEPKQVRAILKKLKPHSEFRYG